MTRYRKQVPTEKKISNLIKVVAVSQFFDMKGKSWIELMEKKEYGVLPSTDKKAFLWSEKPIVKMVSQNEEPRIGSVWYKKGKNGMPEIYRTNYDTSD